MKRLMLLVALAAALRMAGMIPFESSDAAQLLPIHVLTVDVDAEQILLDGGAAKGAGRDLDAALADLRSRAEGDVFLATTEQVVLSGGAVQLLPQIVHWQALRPATGICVAPNRLPDVEAAEKFLQAHDPGVTLQQVRAAMLRQETAALPQLHVSEGGLRLYGTKTDR